MRATLQRGLPRPGYRDVSGPLPVHEETVTVLVGLDYGPSATVASRPILALRMTRSRTLLALLAALSALAGCTSASPRLAAVVAPAPADPVGLVPWAGGLAVAVGGEVRLVRDGRVTRSVRLPGEVLGVAVGEGDTLWVATGAGLAVVAGPTADAVAVPLPTRGRTLAVATGPGGRVWASVLREGAYVREGGRWTALTGSPVVSGIVPVGRGLWYGTHQGVVRRGDGPDARFTEEGTTEHGLLDNVVDRLFQTADGVLWAVHPDGVSVFADGEPHGLAFVGRRGAALHDAVALPEGGYLLATSDGLLLVPALSERPEGFYEVYADSGTDALPAPPGLVPEPLRGSVPTRLALSPDGAAVWLASRAGVWAVRTRDLRRPMAAGAGA